MLARTTTIDHQARHPICIATHPTTISPGSPSSSSAAVLGFRPEMAMANGGGAKMIPSLDLEGAKAHNLIVLQRSDPSVEEILFTAVHVTVYDFNIELNQWGRKDVEGPFFVVKRNAQPRFQFIVLNRRTAANLVEDILGDFEYEIQPPYLLYRNASQEVNGIWFFNRPECEGAADLFDRIIGAYSKASTRPQQSTRSDVEESGAAAIMSMAEGPLEPPVSSSSTSAPVADNSSAALHNAAGSNCMPPTQQQQLTSVLVPLQRLNLGSAQIPASQTPASLAVSTSMVPSLDKPESNTRINGHHAANLIRHSLFTPTATTPVIMVPVPSSSLPTASTLQPSLTPQQTSVTPLLHPYPTPIPSASLTPIPSYGPVITKDKVRDALLRLAQSDQFVDIVYREILNS